MIIHIMPYMKAFSVEMIAYIQNNTIGDHFFYLFCFKDNVYLDSYKNIKIYRLSNNPMLRLYFAVKLLLNFLFILITNKNIIFHSLFLPKTFFLVMLLIPNFKKLKWNWIAFGGDIYDKSDFNIDVSILKKVFYNLKACQIRNMGYFTTLTAGDYRYIMKNYKANGKNYVILYGNPQNLYLAIINNLNKNSGNKLKKYKNSAIKILIGNSATRENQHEEVFNTLLKYAQENIEIFVPLSYGDPVYAANIQAKGINMFGRKFNAILNLMSFDNYISFLNSIDIAIFNNNRQQGLGNIYMLIGLGKKLFIREDTSMWSHFRDHVKINLNSIESIQKLNFQEFDEYNEFDINNNSLLMKTFLNEPANSIDIWNQIIMDMERE